MSKFIIENNSSASDLKALKVVETVIIDRHDLKHGMYSYPQLIAMPKMGIIAQTKANKGSIKITISNGKLFI